MSLVAAIVQARMGSTRLPGKVLMDLQGQPLLAHVVRRAQAVTGLDLVIVATTTADRDRPIMALAEQTGALTFAGSEDDVLDRYYQAARHYSVSVIMRLTADCPLLDPEVSSLVLARFQQGDVDYTSNLHPPTYPDGLDTEVFPFAALKRAWEEAKLASEREHVMPYIWKDPSRFRLANVARGEDLSALHWSVDRAQDLEFVRAVLRNFPKDAPPPDMSAILKVLASHPELNEINAGSVRNEGYNKSVREDRRLL